MLIKRQFLIFLVVGFASAGLDVGILQAMVVLGVNHLLATTTGFFVALLFNYAAHASYTFKSRMSTSVFLCYISVVCLNYFITVLFVTLAYSVLGKSVLAGKIASLPIVAINGYLLGKYWIFRGSVSEKIG